MSAAALVGALISGLVLIGVAALVARAWVDDRRREDDEIFLASRPAVRARAAAARTETPVAKVPEAGAPVVVLPVEAEPAIDLEAPEPEPESPTEAEMPAEALHPPVPVKPQPPGSWQIHTLRNGEKS